MLRMTTTTRLACERLVQQMEMHLARPLQPEVRQAFLSVPRHLFVEGYYQQQGNRRKWAYIAAPTREEIYQDEPLVTKIDKRGYPLCSSSLPGVMAQQLEALQLHDHQRVLEIGTGTGYNAALMSELVKPSGQIVSLDIDESLVASASLHFSSANTLNVIACQGNGTEGECTFAPYDRLLATCGVKSLPRPWIEQLKEEGLLIANVLLNLASIFVQLRKIGPAQLEGQLLAIDAVYMEMRGPEGITPFTAMDWAPYDALPRHEVKIAGSLTTLLQETAFAVLLQCQLPTLEKHLRWNYEKQMPDTYLLDQASKTAVRVEDTTLICYGQQALAQLLEQSILLYGQLGHPGLEHYLIQMNGEQAFLRINDYSCQFPL